AQRAARANFTRAALQMIGAQAAKFPPPSSAISPMFSQTSNRPATAAIAAKARPSHARPGLLHDAANSEPDARHPATSRATYEAMKPKSHRTPAFTADRAPAAPHRSTRHWAGWASQASSRSAIMGSGAGGW